MSRRTPMSSPLLSDAGSSPSTSPRSRFSPLELLVQRGQQVQQNAFGSQTHSGKGRLYERATALSRKTSVRQPAYQPSPEPDQYLDPEDDGARSIRSIDLQSESSYTRSPHTPSLTSPKESSVDTFGHRQHEGQLESWQRQPSSLLNNAFRSSMASDISFNSITDAAQRMSIAGAGYSPDPTRRLSTDTVRSSEFGEDGRWGRAWNTRADDEESIYSERAYSDYSHSQDAIDHIDEALFNSNIQLDPPNGGGGLGTLASLWAEKHRNNHKEESNLPAIQKMSGEKIVSLTSSTPAPTQVSATPRQSIVPQFESQSDESQYRNNGLYPEQTPMASSSRYTGHQSTDSSTTIHAQSSPEGARVFVYPPTPSGSIRGVTQSNYVDVPHARRAEIETLPANVPFAPSSLLNRPLGSPQLSSNARKTSGHPTGRAPPPPPPVERNHDATSYFQGVDQPIYGTKRAQAIAQADGRMSMVSDLDVETLRLDGSSRRDSSSTIATLESVRLPAGSIYHDSAASVAQPASLRTAKSGATLASPSTSNAHNVNVSPAVDTRTGPTRAEDFLSQGITYHEHGDLARSAFYFERSAKVDGGCVVGMCMFGMALREGWGARKDPAKGFTWIQRAAAKAGDMMASDTQTPRSDSELNAIKSELKLSVYELGKCYCYGWGVKMDKLMALEYFELAAKLGDADAQAEAGALYAAGKGCKKDLKKAAMYYRMAEQGGYDTVGLSWIHKDKYK